MEPVALFRWLPRLAARVPWVRLGDWPTPVDRIEIDGRSLWIKREGDSSALYGGNKIRTLEAWLGHTLAVGAKRIWAIGAYGSNHAIATVLHARALGLDAGAIVFPQPASAWATENAGALIGTGCPLVRLRSVVSVPLAGIAIARREKTAVVMPPGGATPIGTLGALSAAFELAEQIAAGQAPPPARIVIAVGSTCTTAGLLAGIHLAHAVGAWRWPLPVIHGVRVTPWPVTSRMITAGLAARTLARIAKLGGPTLALSFRELVSRLVIDGRELGAGYGRPTAQSAKAREVIEHAGASLRLDGVYSAKAAAALLRLHRNGIGPLLFWATKSTVTLGEPAADMVAGAPRALRRWLAIGGAEI
ncbi:MAG: 1-aminocyclopropane-carboxylate deaminase [Myxococcales bacterium]|nr:1-aminocyclopropane-carboxylate deaminase [Myxococcales bacterium]